MLENLTFRGFCSPCDEETEFTLIARHTLVGETVAACTTCGTIYLVPDVSKKEEND